MWRNFITTFERSLVITHRYYINRSHLKWNGHVASKHGSRSLTSTATLHNTVSARAEEDGEYVVPYRLELEEQEDSRFFVQTLLKNYNISPEDIKQIRSDKDITKRRLTKSWVGTLEVMLKEGITKDSFVEHPWTITITAKHMSEKIRILKSITSLQDINAFVPFLRVPMPRLRKLVAIMNQDAPNIPYGNRVYYTAEKLKVPAKLVTKYLANRLFVLEIPLEVFKNNLEHMITYNVESLNLLKDLWAFRYRPRSVELRLRRALLAKKGKIMPWMVRCPESILQRSLDLKLNEQKVLKDKSTVAEYIGERLGFSPEEAQIIMDRHPQVNTVRVPKIKEVLDYLLIEEKFSRHEIAQVPRVLCHSLKTTRERIEELKRINCRPSSLVIVCRSQREFDKFVNAWTANYKNYKTVKNTEEDGNKETER